MEGTEGGRGKHSGEERKGSLRKASRTSSSSKLRRRVFFFSCGLSSFSLFLIESVPLASVTLGIFFFSVVLRAPPRILPLALVVPLSPFHLLVFFRVCVHLLCVFVRKHSTPSKKKTLDPAGGLGGRVTPSRSFVRVWEGGGHPPGVVRV